MSNVQCPIEQFKLCESTEWENWLERIELWLITQGITANDIKKATILTYFGPEVYCICYIQRNPLKQHMMKLQLNLKII